VGLDHDIHACQLKEQQPSVVHLGTCEKLSECKQTCIEKQTGMSYGCGLPRAPRASMIRLTHSSWITVKGVSPLVRADTKAMTSATKLTVN